jgi:hypothetical protein
MCTSRCASSDPAPTGRIPPARSLTAALLEGLPQARSITRESRRPQTSTWKPPGSLTCWNPREDAVSEGRLGTYAHGCLDDEGARTPARSVASITRRRVASRCRDSSTRPRGPTRDRADRAEFLLPSAVLRPTPGRYSAPMQGAGPLRHDRRGAERPQRGGKTTCRGHVQRSVSQRGSSVPAVDPG